MGAEVIVADDDAVLRGLLSEGLREAGCEVREVADGLALLDIVAPWLKAHEVPATCGGIVLDYLMPCFDGLQILKGLSELRHRPRIVLITGANEEGLFAEAKEFGADFCLAKPFSMDQLLKALGVGIEDEISAVSARPDSEGCKTCNQTLQCA